MKALRALLVLSLLAVPWTGHLAPAGTPILGDVAWAAPEPGNAPAPPAAPDVDVDVAGDSTTRHVISFDNPIVLAAAGIGVLLLIVLIAMAVRGGGTTIVRER